MFDLMKEVYMYTKTSQKRISECHKELQVLATKLESYFSDLQVSCGYRGEKEQNDAFAKGVSKLKFPKSKHNTNPSDAIDFVFITNGKADWTISKYKELIIKAKEIAKENKINIICGGDWKTFKDYPHIERV